MVRTVVQLAFRQLLQKNFVFNKVTNFLVTNYLVTVAHAKMRMQNYLFYCPKHANR
jgi:hypothetical protein